jgi:hypothetical protein
MIIDNYIVKKRKPEQPRDPVVRVGVQPEPNKPAEVPKFIGLGRPRRKDSAADSKSH